MGAGTVVRHMYTLYKEMMEQSFGEDECEPTLSLNHGYPVQAHHLISCSVMQKLEDGDMARLAEDSEYDINNGHNGLALPAYFGHQRREDKVRHRGGHWEDYYEKVRTELAKVYKRHKNKKPCEDEKARESIKGDLFDLETLIKKKLEKPTWWLYDWSQKLWKADYRDEGAGAGAMRSSGDRETSSSAGEDWIAKFPAGQVRRRHKVVNGKPVLLDSWYEDKYGYPVPGSPTA